jgi:hypothetical protein
LIFPIPPKPFTKIPSSFAQTSFPLIRFSVGSDLASPLIAKKNSHGKDLPALNNFPQLWRKSYMKSGKYAYDGLNCKTCPGRKSRLWRDCAQKTIRRASFSGLGGQDVLFPRAWFLRCRGARPGARWAQFETIRRRMMPFAEARGILTDEDVFSQVS